MSVIEVHHQEHDRFRIDIRGHEIVVDQPLSDGGSDMGPTPTELFVAALAGCVAFYGGRFLVRHGLPVEGFEVGCDFAFALDRPSRVSTIDIRVSLPAGFPSERRAAFLSVLEHCTVHNSMRQAPQVRIDFSKVGTVGLTGPPPQARPAAALP